MKDGKELRMTRQCILAYFIKPFEDVLCDVAPLSVADTLFEKPYLWDRHGTYQSQPQKVITKIQNQWYGVLEQQPTSTVSMIYVKQTNKLINHAQNFALIMIRPQHSLYMYACIYVCMYVNVWITANVEMYLNVECA